MKTATLTSERHEAPTVLSTLRRPAAMRTEIFGGMVTALALIPETISFSIVAGVDPAVGLFTSFIMAMVIAVTGGRPAMVSAAAGSVALVVAPLVRAHGMSYLVAAVILGGALQIALSAAGVTKLIRFLPGSVVTGFVNSLAILIFTAQVPHLIGVPWLVYPMVAVGVAVMVIMPRLTALVPAPLVVTALLTIAAIVFAWKVPTVGDEGDLSSVVPHLALPGVPFTWTTLGIIAPYAVALALVGLLETLITAQLVDEITETGSNKRREGWGLGLTNIVAGFFGGMGGCAMIGQTMINVKTAGARTRISTFVAGLSLMVMVLCFNDVLARIPMAALVAVMIMVSVATMNWRSLSPRWLRHKIAWRDTAAMVATVAAAVPTHNLAYGVIAGVAVAVVLRFVPGGRGSARTSAGVPTQQAEITPAGPPRKSDGTRESSSRSRLPGSRRAASPSDER